MQQIFFFDFITFFLRRGQNGTFSVTSAEKEKENPPKKDSLDALLRIRL